MSRFKPYQLWDLTEDFKVTLAPPPCFDPIPEDFANTLFNKIAETKPLFNGTMVCVHEFSDQSVSTYTISYKDYLAAHHYPNYTHRHKPLAVSGWVCCQDQILIGRRSQKVMQYSGYYELVPSGGVDERAISEKQEIQFQKAILNEFEEETGLPLCAVEKVQPEAFVFCPTSILYDICSSIHIKQDFKGQCQSQNEEYSELFWVPKKELENFTHEHQQKIVSTSLALIRHKILT